MSLTFGSFCSGIGAPETAWATRMGWRPLFVSEIEPFPCAVLSHHHPGVPNLGDMTKIDHAEIKRRFAGLDVVVAGTPCQSFSVAGLRKGLADPSGNLALVLLGLIDSLRPRWVVWENVDGVRSSGQGRDFGSFLGGLGQLGYGWAYRVLDAQFAGVPQRRRRVFVVGCAGSWPRAAAVLFERESLCGHPAPSREAGARVAGTIAAGAHPGSYNGQDAFAGSLIAFAQNTRDEVRMIPGDPCHPLANGAHPPAVAFGWQNSSSQGDSSSESVFPTLDKSKTPAVAYAIQERAVSENLEAGPQGKAYQDSIAYTLEARTKTQSVATPTMAVRRLTPLEAERLMAFPDGHTAIQYRGKPAADGPRYRALGNSMVVNELFWLGGRIQMIDRENP